MSCNGRTYRCNSGGKTSIILDRVEDIEHISKVASYVYDAGNPVAIEPLMTPVI